jgi:hypothetical protein
MKSETADAIGKLNAAKLLQGGGAIETSRYSLVHSSDLAIKSASSRKWEWFIAQVHNGIFTIPVQRQICAEAQDDHAWLEILEANGRALAPAFRTLRGGEWYSVPRFPWESLLADCCAELEISHIIRPVFFYPLVFPVLCAGHLPCGWDGQPIPRNWTPKGPEDLPRGKLMVHLVGE